MRRQMMRTTLNIDEKALEEAMEASEARTKTDVVNEALRAFARSRRRRRLLDLRGKVVWKGEIDALRKRR
jgi:Arc/MetJ family transcription regulator